MPKRESKVKEWLEERAVTCPQCKKAAGTVVVEKGGNTPVRYCDTCKERSVTYASGDLPTAWPMIANEIHLCGKPRRLTMEEIAILSREGAIAPLLPGALCCPAFGLFLIQMPKGGGK